MPLRDFKCVKCGHLKEVYFHKESEITLSDRCPKCGKKADWVRMPPMVAPGNVKGGTPRFFPGK